MLGKALVTAAAGNAAGEATYVEDVFSTYLYTGNDEAGGFTDSNGRSVSNGIALSSKYDLVFVAADDGNASDYSYGGSDDWREVYTESNTTAAADLTIYAAALAMDGGVTYDFDLDTANSNAKPTFGFFSVKDHSIKQHSVGDEADATLTNISLGNVIVLVTFNKSTVSFTAPSGFTLLTSELTGNSGSSADLYIYYKEADSTTETADLSAMWGSTTDAIVQLFEMESSDSSVSITVEGTSGTAASTSLSHTFTSHTPSSSSINGLGGLVWVKNRTDAENHVLADTERGVNKILNSNSTSAESTGSGIIESFTSNGFAVGTDNTVNRQNRNYASWTFRKQEKFFDVVTYTGNGTNNHEISHNLGSVPGCIIVKCTSATNDWAVYHRGTDATNPSHKVLFLNSTSGLLDNSSYWRDTPPTSTNFTLGTNTIVNQNGQTYVAYLFAHNNGDGIFGENGDQDIIKCGSFSTDASGDADIDIGFEPQWVLLKGSDFSINWYLWDNMRGMVVGGNDAPLFPNTSGAETSADNIQPNATGFHIDGTASKNWIYIAIRRGPMKTPTSGTEVFAIDSTLTGGSTPEFYSGFPVDMGFYRAYTANSGFLSSRLRQGRYLTLGGSTAAEVAAATLVFDYQDGWRDPTLANYASWMFRRAPGFFDVVDIPIESGTGFKTVNHNLTVAPELIITKSTSATGNWPVWHKDFTTSEYLQLNTTAQLLTYTNLFGDTLPDATSFEMNYSGFALGSRSYIAFLFASVPGVSKVGSFSHTSGSTTDVDCGFENGARFILLKRYSGGTANWVLLDTDQGIVAGNDPYISLNTTGAQVTTADLVDPLSSGFQVADSGLGTGEYIFLAIA